MARKVRRLASSHHHHHAPVAPPTACLTLPTAQLTAPPACSKPDHPPCAVPDVLVVSPAAAYPVSAPSSPRRAILGLRAHGRAVPDVLVVSPAAAYVPSAIPGAVLGLRRPLTPFSPCPLLRRPAVPFSAFALAGAPSQTS
ncbi:hypothetical protein AURDEDRAFT_175691 [Auricularia subglabra TFB-10046 SS5]|nr:hypothetical protein AURDEDRAFT_175691 [Auricularia subglabra TFB-10046 SS5]